MLHTSWPPKNTPGVNFQPPKIRRTLPPVMYTTSIPPWGSTYSGNWWMHFTTFHVVFQHYPQKIVKPSYGTSKETLPLTIDLLPMPSALANTRSTRKVGTTKSSFFPWSTVSESSEMFSFNCSSSLTSTEQNRLLGRRSIMVLNNSIFLRWNIVVAAMFTFARRPFPSRHGHADSKSAPRNKWLSIICENAEGFCHGKKLSVGYP